jgi:NADPH2:quinone reductase
MPLAVIADQFGPPESYQLREFDPGPPGTGEIRVAIKVAGISYVDVLTAMGKYQFHPPLPFIPGSEYAGVVEALGAGVTGFAIGDRVNGSGMGGIFAQVNNFQAANVNKVAEEMDLEIAAIFPVNYLTAWHALVDRGRARKGEALLVLGAAGGTGFAAIQVGKYLGLRVIASASSADKRAAALAGGADVAVATGADDWRDQVKAANGGKPIDIVFDGVGGDATELAFRTLGYDGRHLVVGFPAGMASLKTNLALIKRASLVGVDVRGAGIERPETLARSREAVQEMVRAGAVKPAIARRYALADYAEAMNAAYGGKEAGRIVLLME